MAQSNNRTHSTQQADPPSEALEAAEQRAEVAEQQVNELQQRIEALESSSGASSDEPARPVRSAESTGSAKTSGSGVTSEGHESEAVAALRQDSMMDHLLNALEEGQDIGHYGRLVFAMVAHHFISEDTTIEWLTKDADFSPEQAEALVRQVESRNYNPPRRDRILAWQREQEFPILPYPDDPDCGNLYRNLKFPQSVYEHIHEYQEEKVHADAEVTE